MKWLVYGLLIIVGLFALNPQPTYAQMVIVSPDTPQGWSIEPHPAADSAPYTFLEAGGLEFGPIDGAEPQNKFIMKYLSIAGTLTSDFGGFDYDYNIDGSSTAGAVHIYINMYIDSASNGIGTFATW